MLQLERQLEAKMSERCSQINSRAEQLQDLKERVRVAARSLPAAARLPAPPQALMAPQTSQAAARPFPPRPNRATSSQSQRTSRESDGTAPAADVPNARSMGIGASVALAAAAPAADFIARALADAPAAELVGPALQAGPMAGLHDLGRAAFPRQHTLLPLGREAHEQPVAAREETFSHGADFHLEVDSDPSDDDQGDTRTGGHECIQRI